MSRETKRDFKAEQYSSPSSQRARIEAEIYDAARDDFRALYEVTEGRTRAEHAAYLGKIDSSARDAYERGAQVYGDVLVLPREASGDVRGADATRLGTYQHAVKLFSRFTEDKTELARSAEEFVELGRAIAGQTADSHTRYIVFREYYDRTVKNEQGKYRPPHEQRTRLTETLMEMRDLARAMRAEEWANDKRIEYVEINDWEREIGARERDAMSETHGRLTAHIEGQPELEIESEAEREIEVERETASRALTGEHDSVRLDTLPPLLTNNISETERERLFRETLPRLDRHLERGASVRSLIQVLNHQSQTDELKARDEEVSRRLHGESIGSERAPEAVTRVEQIHALVTLRTLATNARNIQTQKLGGAPQTTASEYTQRMEAARHMLLDSAVISINDEIKARGFSIAELSHAEKSATARLAHSLQRDKNSNFVFVSLAADNRTQLPINSFNEYKTLTATAEIIGLNVRLFRGRERDREITGYDEERNQLYNYQKAYIRYRMRDGDTRLRNENPLYRDFIERLDVARTFDELRQTTNLIRRENYERSRQSGADKATRETHLDSSEQAQRPLTESEMRQLFLAPMPNHYTDEMRRFRLDRSSGAEPRERRIEQLERGAIQPSPALQTLLDEFNRTAARGRPQYLHNVNLFIAELINPPSPERHRISRFDLHAEHARLAPTERDFLFRTITKTKEHLKNDLPLPERERVTRIADERTGTQPARQNTEPQVEQLRLPVESASFRHYTGAAAWREAELLVAANERLQETRQSLHHSQTIVQADSVHGVTNENLKTIIALLRNFKHQHVAFAAEHLRSSDVAENRQYGEIVTAFQEMKRTVNADGRTQYQIQVQAESAITREGWQQLLNELQPQLATSKASEREKLTSQQAKHLRRTALAEVWGALTIDADRQLPADIIKEIKEAPALVQAQTAKQAALTRAAELQHRVAIAESVRQEIASPARSDSADKQNRSATLQVYSNKVKAEYLAAFPQIDDAAKTLAHARTSFIAERETRLAQERAQTFTELRPQMEHRVGEYLKEVLREHRATAFEAGRGGSHHASLVGGLMKKTLDERGVTLASLNLSEKHLEQAAQSILNELPRELQNNRRRQAFSRGERTPSSARDSQEISPVHELTHDQTGHVQTQNNTKDIVSSHRQNLDVEETRVPGSSPYEIDDELIAQRVGSHLAHTQDVSSRARLPAANLNRRPSNHNQIHDHSQPQEHVRQYTLTR
jgi:hypothetical protein